MIRLTHKETIKDKTKYDQINNSYVEFEYNGLKYMANWRDILI